MPFKDLREYISKLEKEGELQRIGEEVDWNLEAGAVLRRSAEAHLPAVLLEKIKGYPEGYRLCGGLAANYRRLAITLDLAPDTHPKDIIDEILRRRQVPLKPELVQSGPCKENIHVGDVVDLLKFPVPMIHGGDGGRYIGTWHLTITKDLDSDWVNWGMYRHMLQNKNSIGVFNAHQQHLLNMYTHSYEARNKPMEIAIAIGVEPVLTLAATTSVPHGVSEVDIAGGMRLAPVELVKCETIGLSVPATSEIVIEGEVRPGDRMDEGPFGEFSGYMSGLKQPRPVVRVKAVTHRNNPILTMSCPGIPTDDDFVLTVTKGIEALEPLRARGLPVTGVSVFPEGGLKLIVVAVKPIYGNIAEEVAHVVWGSKIGPSTPYLIVVENDVDPFDLGQVVHALSTKCHPYRGIVRLEHATVTHLTPFLSRRERQFNIGAKAYFDCTWPVDWERSDVPKRISLAEAYPAEIQQKVLALWQRYGH